MRGHGADQNLIAFFANVRQILDTADVHEQLWLREPQLHRWNQAVAAGEYLCLVRMSCKRRDCFVECLRRLIIKLCRNHNCLLPGSAGVSPAMSALARTSH